jgi:deazaflavin-dependent oxidoreductase (nitroreductase family)
VNPTAGRTARLSRVERLSLFVERGLDKWLTPIGVWVMRRTKGAMARLWKVDVLVLTTHGRRSGRPRTVVLRYFPDGEAMILAAANDGGANHPGWYYNLTAEPLARVEIKGRSSSVRAAELPAAEAADWWRQIVRIQPSYDRFARATSRTIPILRLTPTTLASAGRSSSA